MAKKLLNFVIGFGGESAEHDISIITAIQIYKRYRREDYNLVLMYVTREGQCFIGDGLDEFSRYKNFNSKGFTEVTLQRDKGLYKIKNKKLTKLFDIDFFINCFHGGSGENGIISGILEQNGILNSSSNHTALGISMDKYLTKLISISLDVNVVDFFTVNSEEWVQEREKIAQAVLQFDFPVVVKPISQGSSIGVSFVGSYGEFVEAVNLAFEFDSAVIIERAIINKREFNCCAFKRFDGQIVCAIDEPKTDKVVISFSDKYLAGKESVKGIKGKNIFISSVGMENQDRERVVNIKQKLKNKIINNTKLLYNTLNMCGVVRFDYMLDEESGMVYLGEINAVPGSLGYYFFENVNLVEEMYEASKRFEKLNKKKDFKGAPSIFN